MSRPDILDTPLTQYAYTNNPDRQGNRRLVIWCWSHDFKKWGSCVNPKRLSDWHWGTQELPRDAVSMKLPRGLYPYDAGREMGVIK